MQKVDKRIEDWKKKLLDLGKRNRMINFKETKRSNVNILKPTISELYNSIVKDEKVLSFAYPVETGDITYTNIFSENNEDINEKIHIISGDVETNQVILEQQKTLKSLRNKSKTSLEEQGVNTLYLALGFLTWKESVQSSQVFKSPIILVPVSLTIESLTDPYKIKLHDDEIVVNPTLKYKLENDFNIILPEFDSDEDDIESYLESIREIIVENNWKVTDDVSLSIFSFLKINMYKDLHNHNDILKNNFVIKALAGDVSEVTGVTDDLQNYNHDKFERPIDVYQVVDADSSQQDAIVLSKKGISFVLQGPPGTGKSQTITNIISEALSDGKKVLFVSEKMAALEVVYKRLTASGLADFCLTLHNHKANKKEILANLESTLNIDRAKLKENIIYELEVLSKERGVLNKYVQELHTINQPLGKSIFEVNGIIAKLNDAPNILFNFKDIGKVTSSDINEFEYLIRNFSKTIEKLDEEYDVNVWKGSNVAQVTHELRHDIETKSKNVISIFNKFIEENSQKFTKLGLENEISFSELDVYRDLFEICEQAHNIPNEWLEDKYLNQVLTSLEGFENIQQIYNQTLQLIKSNFNESILEVDGKKIKDNINLLFEKIEQNINRDSYTTRESIFLNIGEIDSYCGESLLVLERISSVINKLDMIINDLNLETLSDINNILPILRVLDNSIEVTEKWFEFEERNRINSFCDELENDIKQIVQLRTKILEEYEKEIFSIDCNSILKRFKTDYTSVFKSLKSSYRSDIKTIKGLKIIPVKKISDIDIVNLLSDIKRLNEKEEEFTSKQGTAVELLGSLFTGESTQFNKIRENVEEFKVIEKYFNNGIPNEVKNIILTNRQANNLGEIINSLDTLIKSSEFVNIRYIIDKILLEELNFNTVNSVLKAFKIDIKNLNQSLEGISKHANTGLKYQDVKDIVSNLIILQDTKSKYEYVQNELSEKLKFLFDGMETNCETVRNAIIWTSSFNESISKVNCNIDFARNVTSLKYKSVFNELVLNIKNLIDSATSDFNWLNKLYLEEYQMYTLDLKTTNERLTKCITYLYGLEKWIDFKNARKQCSEKGLDEVIETVLDEKIASEQIVDGFKKRFYKLWLDNILQEYPAVQQFRRKTHEEMIDRFRETDLKQMKIAQLRIKEKLIQRLPDVNRATSAIDEVGILRRELAKQRKIMPIRKLFEKIPNLLPTLKPCLMMSPLSVSLFLESERYKFDLVIFDEASQVCTENAIGALTRSKQVIVAGDNKQLPPTNFFGTATAEGDYDVDSEEEIDDGEYESILDEMLTVFPERSLKWHYRSKHEQLIAFSNVKIYNQSLITFPSPAENIKNNGVEYVFVENGIYDRGGKKNNVNEAKRVAKMVFEHFKTLGSRSLGVIAFSSAQQQAIDDEITKLRIENPAFEPFFDEDKNDAFFVKNLENVQGDERDTIIFSIGYAKDQNGQMFMNFGPLSKTGGYRRLNVAITRAKYNLKLVGSIRPTDIRVSDTSPEGVKMLRSYIEFAINGKSALENELKVNSIIEVDSPFEEAVYDFLVSKGYKVSTQVGCSGYRIDLAIHHPTLDGRFVIGVECDGATYHSSRTARERDRLRQTVLEDMGWKFHRIWSTDWIKDPITEGELLIKAIEGAILGYTDDFEVTQSFQDEFIEKVDDFYETDKRLISKINENSLNFETYIEADPFSFKRVDNGLKDAINSIKHIVEIEYPIHYELLCKRIAPLFGNQKATVKIRNTVDLVLENMSDDVEIVGEFIYPKTYQTIKPKTACADGTVRPINYISDKEIEAAMLMVLTNSFGLNKSGLFQTTSKEFGFNRSGANITSVFDEVFNSLIASGTLSIIEDKICINKLN